MTLFCHSVARQIEDRLGFRALESLRVEDKPDQTQVTEVDRRVEEIVEQAIRERWNDVRMLGEESDPRDQATVEESRSARWFLTVDGIDGTGDFIRHINGHEPNSKWLAGMTCLMRRSERTDCFEPELALAYRPYTKELFVFEDGHSWIVTDVFGPHERTEPLRVPVDGRVLGALDVALKKPGSPWEVRDESAVLGYGPSGYNLAELARSALPGAAHGPTFTLFQYKAWDFGLWPVLAGAGYQFFNHRTGEQVHPFDPRWFQNDQGAFGIIRDPLIICAPGSFDAARRVIRHSTVTDGASNALRSSLVG